MGKIKDIKNHRFGRLRVLEFAELRNNKAYWKCVCDCGKISNYIGMNLRNGHTQSCGCLHKEATANINKSHGLCGTPIYGVWRNMINRCINPIVKNYNSYGGRGIKVCDRWLYSFEFFLEDMGYPPSPKHSIERIDNNGDYEPSNCIWATRKKQARNTRTNRLISFNGQTKTLAEWSEIAGLELGTLWMRFKRGWSIEKALTTKKRVW